ncbi:MAG: hypothetical protein HKP62_07415 [Sulfurovum sp.]|nr:hypothetical protein [Sulfurovum sp.]MBT8349254.1 hypothetical protein [Sulfurovum sp.]NNJ45828.1 hypothetical protein [Sulfurovum sp.]
MLGLGAGMQMENVNDSHPTHYLYMAYENVFGDGKGYNTESLKLYGWYQKGKNFMKHFMTGQDMGQGLHTMMVH